MGDFSLAQLADNEIRLRSIVSFQFSYFSPDLSCSHVKNAEQQHRCLEGHCPLLTTNHLE